MNFENIIKSTQAKLKVQLPTELKKLGYKPDVKKGFIYAKGTVPVLLVAHMDTVHAKVVKTILYRENGNIISSPEGIGGDDRAGIYMILQIIKKHRCHVLFCEDEEIGGVGARFFAASNIFPDVNYMVELDRRGSNDAVFYDCDNKDFTKFICDFGFKEAMGSFSDISIVAPYLGIAAVNISAGYYHEHSSKEYVNIAQIERNIKLVSKMVQAKSNKFVYKESKPFCGDRLGNYFSSYDDYGMAVQQMNLMYIPMNAYVVYEGEMVDNMDFLIDSGGNVYEYAYLDGYWAAHLVDGASAFCESGLALRFNEKDAELHDTFLESWEIEQWEEEYYEAEYGYERYNDEKLF